MLADPTVVHPPDFAGGLEAGGRDEADPTVAQPPDLKPLDTPEVATGAIGAADARLLKPALLQPLPAVLTEAAAASGAV